MGCIAGPAEGVNRLRVELYGAARPKLYGRLLFNPYRLSSGIGRNDLALPSAAGVVCLGIGN